MHLLSLAQDNVDNFSILISNSDEDYFDEEYLKLFPKDINIIIPKRKSIWFKETIRNLGFTKISDESEIETWELDISDFVALDFPMRLICV